MMARRGVTIIPCVRCAGTGIGPHGACRTCGGAGEIAGRGVRSGILQPTSRALTRAQWWALTRPADYAPERWP